MRTLHLQSVFACRAAKTYTCVIPLSKKNSSAPPEREGATLPSRTPVDPHSKAERDLTSEHNVV
jgi:hypothetical protein